MAKDIFDYVLTEKNTYEAGPGVPVTDNWYWNMWNHINYTLLMKNGQFPLTQSKMGVRPNKNIILPILNVAHRTEGFDVKDIQPYVDDPDYFHLSLLVQKFHTQWALKYSIDTFIDEVVEALDYGFVLVKNVNSKRPVVIQPQQIAFVDQTDIMSGPKCFKYQYSIDELLDAVNTMGWDSDACNTAIKYSKAQKTNLQSPGQTTQTPSKYIEVFELEGTFCEDWLTKDNDTDYNETLDTDKYCKQLHIITYIKDEKDQKIGLTLFSGRQYKQIYKLLVVRPIFGRAAGLGRVEELFESQIWVNFNTIHMTNMLREASKVIQVTDDPKFTSRNNTKNLVGGEFLVKDKNTSVQKLDTTPTNITLFERANQEWEQHARTTGSASDPSLGITPTSGTPLGTTQIVTSQGEGIHEYVRGKIAVFMNEIYQDWVIEYLIADMLKGAKWADELSTEELQDVAEKIAINESNKKIKEIVLNGGWVKPEEQNLMIENIKQSFMKGGNKKFMEIVKGEVKQIPIRVKFNIANKQKDLSKMVDKLTNVWRTIFANPQGFAATMQVPGAAKAFNEMLEASGLSPVTFDFSKMPASQQQNQNAPTQTLPNDKTIAPTQ